MVFSQQELQSFTDNIVNVLSHDACRQEYRTFLIQSGRNDLIPILDVWESANHILQNPPGTPEQLKHLRELAEEVPIFAQILSLNDNSNIAVPLRQRAVENLEEMHPQFIEYLTANNEG